MSQPTLPQITFYLDVISPYAYLAFERLPEALRGLSYQVRYKPVLFASLLKHLGTLGPAEIPGKREWTFRQVQWQAQQLGIPLQMPTAHPFNPLGLLRLALACEARPEAGTPNRYVCEMLLRHVWTGGLDAADPARLAALQAQLAPAQDPTSEAVKNRLKDNTAQALAQGVFGVPAFVVDDKVFWGLDALPMLRDYLTGHAFFSGPEWEAAGQLPAAVQRR